jgi:hypothetical protein
MKFWVVRKCLLCRSPRSLAGPLGTRTRAVGSGLADMADKLGGRPDHQGMMFLIVGKSAVRRSVCYNRQTAIGLTRLA